MNNDYALLTEFRGKLVEGLTTIVNEPTGEGKAIDRRATPIELQSAWQSLGDTKKNVNVVYEGDSCFIRIPLGNDVSVPSAFIEICKAYCAAYIDQAVDYATHHETPATKIYPREGVVSQRDDRILFSYNRFSTKNDIFSSANIQLGVSRSHLSESEQATTEQTQSTGFYELHIDHPTFLELALLGPFARLAENYSLPARQTEEPQKSTLEQLMTVQVGQGRERRAVTPNCIDFRNPVPPIHDITPDKVVGSYITNIVDALIASYINPRLHREAFDQYFSKNATEQKPMLPNKILLLGEPGIGKTYVAKMVARMLNVPYVEFSANNRSEYVSVSEQIVANLFDRLRSLNGGVLVLNDLDLLLANRKKTNHNTNESIGVLQVVMSETDGSRSADDRLIFVGTSNVEEGELDQGILSRMGHDGLGIYHIPPPTSEDMVDIIRLYEPQISSKDAAEISLRLPTPNPRLFQYLREHVHARKIKSGSRYKRPGKQDFFNMISNLPSSATDFRQELLVWRHTGQKR